MVSLHKNKKLPDLGLYSIIIFLKTWFKGDWIVENVMSYYEPLIKPNAIVDRHYIWSNKLIYDKNFRKKKKNWTRNMSKEELSNSLKIPLELFNDFNFSNWKNHDGRRQILRNSILPEIGKYLLDCIMIQKQPNLEQFIEG